MQKFGGNVYDPEDIMRRKPTRALTEEESSTMDAIKVHGEILWRLIDSTGEGRDASLAKTYLEEAIQRASRHITR